MCRAVQHGLVQRGASSTQPVPAMLAQTAQGSQEGKACFC